MAKARTRDSPVDGNPELPPIPREFQEVPLLGRCQPPFRACVAGALGLLLRRRWAVWMFGLSVIGLVVTTVYNFVLTNGAEVMGGGAVIFTVVTWLVAILLYGYARGQSARGVLV